jgi:hypothetical protein
MHAGAGSNDIDLPTVQALLADLSGQLADCLRFAAVERAIRG